MTDQRRIPLKTKRLFTLCFHRANDKVKFDYWGKKNLIVLSSLWSDDMDIKTIEVSQNSHLGGTGQRSCSLWPAEGTGKKMMLIEGCCSTSSNLLPNYL